MDKSSLPEKEERKGRNENVFGEVYYEEKVATRCPTKWTGSWRILAKGCGTHLERGDFMGELGEMGGSDNYLIIGGLMP